MRISDWSSDVCSSDLVRFPPDHGAALGQARGGSAPRRRRSRRSKLDTLALVTGGNRGLGFAIEIGRAAGRARVCQYVSISVVAVALKKKKKQNANKLYYELNIHNNKNNKSS